MLEQSVELEFCKERLNELLQSLNSSEAEVSRCKVQLESFQEKEKNYEDALSKATALVEEERENLQNKEKKYLLFCIYLYYHSNTIAATIPVIIVPHKCIGRHIY